MTQADTPAPAAWHAIRVLHDAIPLTHDGSEDFPTCPCVDCGERVRALAALGLLTDLANAVDKVNMEDAAGEVTDGSLVSLYAALVRVRTGQTPGEPS